MPGISGTYGRAGWGGRRTNGTKGWSARGAFFQSIPEGNPLAGTHPIGTYCYHADQKGSYGDTWLWQKGYRGFLQKNRWYAVEQYLKMNTPGKKDGIYENAKRFLKTDIRPDRNRPAGRSPLYGTDVTSFRYKAADSLAGVGRHTDAISIFGHRRSPFTTAWRSCTAMSAYPGARGRTSPSSRFNASPIGASF